MIPMSEKNGVPSSPSLKPYGSLKKILVNDIFRKHYKEYCKKNKGHISPQQYKVINALTTCRTVYLGGHLYKCDSCEKYHTVSTSLSSNFGYLVVYIQFL